MIQVLGMAFKKAIGLSLCCGLLGFGIAGCSDDDKKKDANVAVSIPFEIVVGDELFAVGGRYEGLGINGNDLTVNEVAFYIHDVALTTATGDSVAVELDTSSPFQNDAHALLDFSRDDSQAEPDLTENRAVTGSVPARSYVGLTFTVGVDEAHNHLNSAIAPAPFNVAHMFWSWTGGYKYIRIDGSTDVLDAYLLHLGATQCTAVEGSPGDVTCLNRNVVSVELSSFDLDTSVVVLDIAELFAGADLSTNVAETASGCMSAPSDPDCGAVFAKLGLAHPAQSAGDAVVESAFRLAE